VRELADVGALRVSLTLDSADFSKSMQDINRKLKGLQSEFKASTAGNKLFENSLDGMKLKSNHLSQVLTLQKERVEQLRKQYEQSVATKGADAKETENLLIRYNNALAAMKNTESQLNELNRQIQTQSSAWYKLGESLKSVGNSMKSIGDSMKSAGQTMTTRVTLPIVGLGAAIIKTGADFEESMSKVAAISGATGEDFKKLENQAKELGASTKFSASEAAAGMQYLAMAGFKTQDILSAMPGLLDLAAAGAMDLGRAADITSNIMSGFGIEASKAGHVADVLAKASSSANTNVQQLGEAMVYLAPVSKTLGWTMEEATAAVMALSDAGIQGAQAGAAFSTSLGRLAKPTKEMQSVMKELGLSFFDAQGNMKPLPAIIAELERATKGMTAEQKSAVLTTLFGAEAYKHWAVLVDKGSEALAENIYMLENADGAAKQMADTMSENTKGAWKEFQSAVEGLSIALSDTLLPIVTSVIKKFTEWTRAFSEASPATQNLVLALAAIVAAIGPVLIVLGSLFSSIGTITTAFGALSGAIAAAGGLLPWLGGVLTALTGPIGIAIAAIAGLIAAGVALYKNWDEIKAFLLATWEAIKAAAQAIWNGIKAYFTTVLNIYKTIFTTVWNAIKTALTTVWNAIKTTASTVFNAIKTTISTIFNTVRSVVTSVWDGIKSTLTSIWNSLKSTASSVWNGIKSDISNVVNGIRSTISSVWNSIKSTTASVWNGIKNAITSPIKSAVDFVESQVDKIVGFFRNMKISFPKIKLPHFKLSGNFSLNPPSVPKISVDWYKVGGVFERPVIFGNAGFGDVSEAIVPFEGRHARRIASLIAKEMVNYLSPQTVSRTNPTVIQIVTPDKRTLARWLVEDITEFQELNILRSRRFGGSLT
jgi:TP901 family phage tail tape measure protein